MKIKFNFPKLKWSKNTFSNLSAKSWERLRFYLAKTPSPKELLLKIPSRISWIFLICGFLLADLLTQGVLSTVFLDQNRIKSEISPGKRVSLLKPRNTYNSVTEKNIFCPGCPVPDVQALSLSRPKDCNKAERMPSGPKLLGTIVLSDPQYSVATISSGSESKAIKKGDQVPGAGTVFEIKRKRVCFESEVGMLRYIELPEDKTILLGQPLPSALPSNAIDEIAQNASGEIEIKRDFLISKLSDPSVLTSAASIPIYENGQLVGFKVLSIKPGSVFEQLVQVGDEIRGINGEPITSIPQIQKVFSGIRNVKGLNITINRDGRTLQQSYKVQ